MKFFFLLLMIPLWSCSSNRKVPVEPVKKVTTEVHSIPTKNIKGMITIVDEKEQYKVTTNLSGLDPQTDFAFHIHKNGVCEGPTFASAGEHLNPDNMPHGSPTDRKRHAGDLGNIHSDSYGNAKEEVIIPKIKGDDISEFVGRALLIHAKADDFKTQPSGAAGDRIACGLIQIL
jgi:Cu-Zn family superoxide dismutase